MNVAPDLAVPPSVRSSRSRVLDPWWAGLDKVLAGLFGGLLLSGIVLSAAAGPVAAMRKGIDDPLHFVERQFVFLVPTLILMIGASALSPRQVRRTGVLLGLGALCLMVLTLFVGPEVKGATRWLPMGGFTLQPSELFKPGFVILAAWMLAEAQRQPEIPGGVIAFALYGIAAGILILQPDYGQLLLLTGLLGALLFVAGWKWWRLAAFAGLPAGILAFGYSFAPHVRSRIDRLLQPEGADTYQTDMALDTIRAGGLFGHDISDGVSMKSHLPDAHTDFIFAVAAEEFGFVFAFGILAIFAGIAWRCFSAAGRAEGPFRRLAIAGLAAQFCLQAFINVGVNLGVLPAKGMTLPFISYGGSSLIGSAIAAGFLLALTSGLRPADGAAKDR